MVLVTVLDEQYKVLYQEMFLHKSGGISKNVSTKMFNKSCCMFVVILHVAADLFYSHELGFLKRCDRVWWILVITLYKSERCCRFIK